MATQKDRLVQVLDRMTDVHEKFSQRLDVIDTAQAELIGSVESLRETMHEIRNQLTPILSTIDVDGKEIKTILKTLDGVKTTVDEMSRKYNGALLKAYVDGGQ